MMTKQDLLAELLRLDACTPALRWVTEHPSDDAATIWRSCVEVDWLIWFAGRRNPIAVAAFARRCADRAVAHDVYAAAHYVASAAERATAFAADAAYRASGFAADVAERKVQIMDLHDMWEEIV